MKITSEKTNNCYSPSNREAIEELAKHFYANETRWVPCGNQTRLEWGAKIQEPFELVSVQNLNRIINYSTEDLTITVEAGVTLSKLQQTLQAHNQWLSVDWPWGAELSSLNKTSGSIGGLVARGLSGGLLQSHMGIREQLIGIEMMRTEGVLAKAGGKVVKNVAGYDLMRLLCGSWGSLALITEVTLRTQPLKTSRRKIQISGEISQLEICRVKIIHSHLTPEYLDWTSKGENLWNLEIGLASVSNEAIKSQIEQLKVILNEEKLDFKEKRWVGPLIEQEYPKDGLKRSMWLSRLAIPPANIHKLIKQEEFKALFSWEWRIAAGIGLGDGWCQDLLNRESDLQRNAVINLRKCSQKLGGNLTILKQPHQINNRLQSWTDASSKELIQIIKNKFDPKLQLCKGRLPGISG